MSSSRRAALSLALALAACGGGGSSGDGGGSTPLQLTPAQWTWIDVAGTACSDGSPTGIAVNPATDHDTMLLLFLQPGGACWGSNRPFSCASAPAQIVTGGPFGETEFLATMDSAAGSILDREVTATPFGGATLVFIPYCTGDVHWGSSTEGAWHHAGEANLEEDIAWLKANLPAPTQLVVSGSSAGGFGTLLAHDVARTAWPNAKGYLIDDSGPPLAGSAIPADERQAWYASWNLSATLDPLCTKGGFAGGCQADLSRTMAALQAKYPGDRFALLSNLQDGTIRFFLEDMGASDFQTALTALVDKQFSTATPSLSGGQAFLVAGDGHGLLGDMESYTIDDVTLPEWLGYMVHDDAGWTTLGHP